MEFVNDCSNLWFIRSNSIGYRWAQGIIEKYNVNKFEVKQQYCQILTV